MFVDVGRRKRTKTRNKEQELEIKGCCSNSWWPLEGGAALYKDTVSDGFILRGFLMVSGNNHIHCNMQWRSFLIESTGLSVLDSGSEELEENDVFKVRQVSLLFSRFLNRQEAAFSPFAHPRHKQKKNKEKKRKFSVSSASEARRTMDIYREAVGYLESQQVPGRALLPQHQSTSASLTDVDICYSSSCCSRRISSKDGGP